MDGGMRTVNCRCRSKRYQDMRATGTEKLQKWTESGFKIISIALEMFSYSTVKIRVFRLPRRSYDFSLSDLHCLNTTVSINKKFKLNNDIHKNCSNQSRTAKKRVNRAVQSYSSFLSTAYAHKHLQSIRPFEQRYKKLVRQHIFQSAVLLMVPTTC